MFMSLREQKGGKEMRRIKFTVAALVGFVPRKAPGMYEWS
ncbi:hypothetical protein BTZ20_1091 [Rhodococcus sp. MTM3W5.2]|nr:hypothetical protein BTZ20_1091 [Rhodococcus sp. MTM3W5.2]